VGGSKDSTDKDSASRVNLWILMSKSARFKSLALEWICVRALAFSYVTKFLKNIRHVIAFVHRSMVDRSLRLKVAWLTFKSEKSIEENTGQTEVADRIVVV